MSKIDKQAKALGIDHGVGTLTVQEKTGFVSEGIDSVCKNEKSERKFKETILFTNFNKRVKYFRINLPKEIKRAVCRKL